MLVDGNVNVTSIVDRNFAITDTEALAFSTLCMHWPVLDFYDGKIDLHAEEVWFSEMFKARSHADMSRIVCESENLHLYRISNGRGVSHEHEDFEALFTALRRLVQKRIRADKLA